MFYPRACSQSSSTLPPPQSECIFDHNELMVESEGQGQPHQCPRRYLRYAIRLLKGKVAQDFEEALRGIHSNGVEMGEPCFGHGASLCKDERCMYLPHVV